MSQYFIFSTTAKITKAAARRIQSKIKCIDSTAEFSGPLAIPGSRTTGWIERPNDGTNDYPEQRAKNRLMAKVANKELGLDYQYDDYREPSCDACLGQ